MGVVGNFKKGGETCTAKWVVFSSILWRLLVPLCTVLSGTSQFYLSSAKSFIYEPYYTMTRFPFLMDVSMSLTLLGMWIICRRCPSGSLDMRPSRVFCSWWCVSGTNISYHAISPLFSSLYWLLLSIDCLLVYLLVPVVSCTLLFGYFLYVILGHIGTRSPLFVYIGGLILDGGTSFIICDSGVSILPFIRAE